MERRALAGHGGERAGFEPLDLHQGHQVGMRGGQPAALPKPGKTCIGQALEPVLVNDIAPPHLEEFIAAELDAGRFKPPLKPLGRPALLHGHCHQKAFGAMGAVQKALALVPGLKTATVESSCCGMAGSFGYEAEHFDVSMRMAEADLLPAVRKASRNAIVVADGTSCRHQIADGSGREARHVVRVLEAALERQ
jgi:Fe-S oxidoreductase